LLNPYILKYNQQYTILGKMGKLEFANTSFLIVLLVIVSIAVVGGTAYASHTATLHTGNVVIIQDHDGKGNFFLTDGFMSLVGKSGGTQIIDAKSFPGQHAIFRVTGDGNNAFFTIASTGGQPTLFLKDDDNPNGREYLFRIAQPDTGRFELVDNTAGQVRMSVDKDGSWCIGAC